MSIVFSALHAACEAFDVDAITTIPPLVETLDEQSKVLAVDESLRTMDDRDDATRAQLQNLCMSVAKFTRNLVAAVPQNQLNAFENEPAVRGLLRYHTSYYVMQDAESKLFLLCTAIGVETDALCRAAFPATRMLVQTLSNLVTANEDLMNRLWNSYLALPEEQLILLRLFSVPDARTVMSTFVLVLNCLDASPSRMKILTTAPTGLRLCISYLDRMASLFEDEDAADSHQAFEIGYRVFCKIVEYGAIPAVYEGVSLLITGFFALSSYAQGSIARALRSREEGVIPPARGYGAEDGAAVAPMDYSTEASTEATPLNELDLLLPKASEALVLVTQCLISLALYSEEHLGSDGRAQSGDKSTTPEAKDTPAALVAYVTGSVSRSGSGFVEDLIETLRAFDKFLPRITFGKAAPAPVPVPTDGTNPRMTPDAARPGNGAGRAADPKGFAYLKRDLVRLLGILSSGRRAVQDRNQALVNEIQPLREWDANGVLQAARAGGA
ncbi:hypothetical protein EIP86_005450 [Pleurotus ostreatoroseus]|nr:hypothetical protein EIP86_005450 [Pleurotus ostreatoroseus]